MQRILALLALAAALSACSGIAVQIAPTPTPTVVPTAEPCAVQAASFLSEAEQIMVAWQDAVMLADNTGRGALSPVIAQMQELRRDLGQLEAPECAMLAQRLLVTSMDETIHAYLAFMAQEPNRQVLARFDAASDALEAGTRAIYEIRTGLPMPTATPVPVEVARRETTRLLEAAGLAVIECGAQASWLGQALTAKVVGVSDDADADALRSAMEASKGILHDPALQGFALHILDKKSMVTRSVWACREDIAAYSAGTLTFEDFASKWEYR
jgi:hypothetical protein